MKRALFFLIFICMPWMLMGQKKGISYQAVILDPTPLDIPGNPISGQPLQKGKVTLRFSIGNTSSLDYVEIHETETDEFGLINVMIGQGNTNGSLTSNTSSLLNAKFNSFDAIIWDENQKTLTVGVSFDGGKTFSEVSSQKLSFSPYALYAEAVEYKNVREAPKKLSQFANDSGYLIPKDLDPISESLSITNKTIRTNQLLVDQTFAIVNQKIFSLSDSIQTNSRTIANNSYSISAIEKKLVDVNGLISETKNESQANFNRLGSNINGLQSQLFSTNNALSNLASTYEIVDNKSSATDLGNANPSDQLYPTQKAIKTYVDTKVADLAGGSIADATTLAPGKIQLAGDLGGTAASPTVPALATKENVANKSTNVESDANSDNKYPSVKAVKAYVDQATQGIALQANLDAKANTSDVNAALNTKENASNKSNNTSLGNSEELYPSQKAVKTYVDNQVANGIVSDADANTKGKIQLTGDLGGTAASPMVPGLALKANAADVSLALSLKANTADVSNSLSLKANVSDVNSALANKENSANKSTATALGSSDELYPSQKAVKTYVDAQVASGAPDADANTKGKIQLTGDLGGTAASPTVPGLAIKANAADVSNSLGLKANVSDVTSSLALKAPISNPTFTGIVSGIDKSMVGLSFIDNTSDANKPISTATQTALNLKANAADVIAALANKANTSEVTSALNDKENSANKSTSTTLGTSDVLYPSQKAVKTYVDAQVASGAPDADANTKGKIQLTGDLGGTAASPTVPGLALKANAADVSNSLGLKANVSDVTSSLALKAPISNPTFTGIVSGIDKSMVGLSFIDNTSDANKPISTATQTALNLKANAADVIAALANKANTSEVTSALNDKENSANKSTSTTLGTSDVLYPSQKAVKTYVDAQVASGAPDADANTKGKIQLTGDLGGTAASPTVPGLALKANAADVSNSLGLKANVSDVTSSLALKAPISNPTFTGIVSGIDKSMVGLSFIDNTSDANKPISTATQTALNLKANAADVIAALANKANTSEVTSALNDKENSANKSTSTTLGTSDVLYPSQKAVKTYVDAQVASGAPDADANTKGKIQLTGDLGGTGSTASNPVISNSAVNTNKLADNSVTSSKIVNGTITTYDLADNLITNSKIANYAVDTDEIANGAVTDSKINSVSGSKVNGNISGGAASLVNSRSIYGNSFNGTSSLNQIISSTYGGTGNGFTKFSGPSSSEKTFTLPNSNATLLSSAATVTVAQGGTGANTLASNQVLLGNGTGALQTVAPGNSGNVLMSNGSTWVSSANSSSSNSPHAIGDSYGGGIVFYVYDGGNHGLIAATSDQSSSIDWDLGSSFETRAKANGVGAGLKNTSILIASLLSQRNNSNDDNYNSQNFAAALCNEYTKSETINNIETTYGDWYLPSKYELNLLYLKKAVVGNFSSARYWSSTEYDGSKAWTINFGTQSGSAESSQDKNSSFRVRAIRAF